MSPRTLLSKIDNMINAEPAVKSQSSQRKEKFKHPIPNAYVSNQSECYEYILANLNI